jgi:hypothetical protein
MLQLPTVAVVAHYDTLGAAVDLATGAKDGAGLAAVLELARLFSRLYSQPRNRVAVNFLFVVTGGSKLNYAGTDQWLKSLDSKQFFFSFLFLLLLLLFFSSASSGSHRLCSVPGLVGFAG